jgi:hypothetical protein
VSFGDASKVDTAATFSVAGTYVLRLSAYDGALTTTDDVQVTAGAASSPPPGPEVSARVLDRKVLVGDGARFTGTVGSAVSGQTVHLQRWKGGAWVDVKTTALTAGDNVAFSFTTTSGRSGVVRYRIRVPAYAGIPAGTVQGLQVGYYTARITGVSAEHEWVTVRNNGAVTFNLGGWTLTNRRNGQVLVLDPMRVRPGETVRVHSGSGRNDRDDLFLGRGAIWGRHGVAVLRDDARQLADRFRY